MVSPDPTSHQIWALDTGIQKPLKGLKVSLPSFGDSCLTAPSSVVYSSKSEPCQPPRYSILSLTAWMAFLSPPLSPKHPINLPHHDAAFSKLRVPAKFSQVFLKSLTLNGIEVAHPLSDHREISGSLPRDQAGWSPCPLLHVRPDLSYLALYKLYHYCWYGFWFLGQTTSHGRTGLNFACSLLWPRGLSHSKCSVYRHE